MFRLTLAVFDAMARLIYPQQKAYRLRPTCGSALAPIGIELPRAPLASSSAHPVTRNYYPCRADNPNII